MKKYIIILTLLMLSAKAWSQDNAAKVERATGGVQAGFLGMWIYQESKMSDATAFRIEFGLEGGLWGGIYREGIGVLFRPALNAEPRWYYNLIKRIKKERNIEYNSGSFLSLKLNYQPAWFLISNEKGIRPIANMGLYPSWGIRTMITQRWNVEAGAGLGPRLYFLKYRGLGPDVLELVLNIHLRIGICY